MIKYFIFCSLMGCYPKDTIPENLKWRSIEIMREVQTKDSVLLNSLSITQKRIDSLKQRSDSLRKEIKKIDNNIPIYELGRAK